jgi:hypothetical protein
MKKVCAMLLLLLSVTAFASDNSTANTTAHWNSIVGVITAPGVDNPVSKNIHSGTFAWSASSGNASVDLVTGNTSFAVQGLVINGTMFSGTQGPVPAVTGTLVCNAGTNTEAALDTKPARLSQQGNAKFKGPLQGTVPPSCGNPLFLLRIANLKGANGLWVATGAVRTISAKY